MMNNETVLEGIACGFMLFFILAIILEITVFDFQFQWVILIVKSSNYTLSVLVD